MDSITHLFEMIDSLLIAPFRWPNDPFIGWWLGIFVTGAWCVLLGEMTMALAFRANRAQITRVSREVTEYHDRSMEALRAGDSPAYKSINRLANEAYGRSYFLQIAMACSSLWPLACALGWMDTRFSGIDFALPNVFPLAGRSVGYPFIFIPAYILLRIVTGKLKKLI